MDMSHLKTQIMTMFMMKSAGGGGGGAAGGGGDIYTIVYSMLLMNFVEWLFRTAPGFFGALQAMAITYWKPKKDSWIPLQDKSRKEKELLNSISMMRVFTTDAEKQDKVTNPYVEKVDAVIDFLCSLDNAKHVKMDTRYTLNSTEEIDLTPLLKARVKETAGSDEDSTLEIVVYSSVLKVSEIRHWIDEIHANYVFEKNNKLGNRTYYFNEVPVEPVSQVEIDPAGGTKQSYRWDTMPKQLLFHMNEFNTSKSFANVYGHHVDELKERLDLFIQHPEWYMERGIPHSLGILLHGVPGAGKTSTIKAIAKDTHRHIFNLSLRPYTSQRQLTHLFFNETVVVVGADGAKQTLKIPLNRRVYVIEDIDCLTDVVLDRTIRGDGKGAKAPEGDAVTLSFLLNLLDGVLETPGRILVITSNFPDKLDRALVRPGRIDVTIEFRNTTRAFILDMVNKFYSVEYILKDIPEELEGIFTPAEVMESLCTHFKDPDAALEHMVAKIEAKVASKQGTSLDFLGSPKSMLVYQEEEPAVAVAVAGPIAEEVKAVKVAKAVEEPVLQNEIIDATQRPSVKQVKGRDAGNDYAANKVPVKLTASLESTWSSADFGNVEFQGGHLPGEFGVRSTVDLNTM